MSELLYNKTYENKLINEDKLNNEDKINLEDVLENKIIKV